MACPCPGHHGSAGCDHDGIDPHKASLTAVAVDASGTSLGHRRLLVNAGTLSQLGLLADVPFLPAEPQPVPARWRFGRPALGRRPQ
jgi:hypothetical protein